MDAYGQLIKMLQARIERQREALDDSLKQLEAAERVKAAESQPPRRSKAASSTVRHLM